MRSSATKALQDLLPGADRPPTMRAFLEYLGIVEPRATRREPVALPAWARALGPGLLLALAVVSTTVLAVLRAILP